MAKLAFLLWYMAFACKVEGSVNIRNFTIDRQNGRFIKDGGPFRYISGSLHYFRIPRAYWKDRMRKVRAAGFNTLQTYVEWSFHEKHYKEYNFKGN